MNQNKKRVVSRTKKRAIEQSGLSPVDGQPFNVIVLRWTNCRECGQYRVDRSFENRRS